MILIGDLTTIYIHVIMSMVSISTIIANNKSREKNSVNKKSSLLHVINEYINIVTSARSANTGRTYHNAMNSFCHVLNDHHLSPDSTPISELPDEAISWFISALKDCSPATERLYLTAIVGFYEFLSAERLCEINLPRLRLMIRQRARKPGQRLPQFPYNKIEIILEICK